MKKIIFLTYLFLIHIILILKRNFITILNGEHMHEFYELLPYVNKEKKKPKLLKEIYENNILYINDYNITNKYINYIRSIEGKISKNNKNYLKDLKFDESIFPIRENQLNYNDYGQLCIEEKLINSNIFKIYKNPIISIIVIAFNKENILLKSIRSIQNQSIKNIEIIIVDDCSTDNSYKIYNYLMHSDPRIRIFYHLKNLGCWRSRIDGFLYSKGKYVIHFDAGDLYEDNYVLEDSLNIIKKYKIDAVKTLCRFIYDYQNLTNSTLAIIINDSFTKIAFKPFIEKYDDSYFKKRGWIWTTLVKPSIYTKGLITLSKRVLNFYKNYWEDKFWKKFICYMSEHLLILKRYTYLYFKDGKGEGDFKNNTEDERDNMIQEQIGFLYFYLEFLPKRRIKKKIINDLRKFDNNSYFINFGFLKSKFYLLDDLIIELIHDKDISFKNKLFLKRLLKKSRHKQLEYSKNSSFFK